MWLWCLLAGKTAAFLVPALCQLDYPPELFPEDLEGPQLLLLVPSFELGVQACMLLYKLWGGNISSRTPGDPANMFSYTGPPGIKVGGTQALVSTAQGSGFRVCSGTEGNLCRRPGQNVWLLQWLLSRQRTFNLPTTGQRAGSKPAEGHACCEGVVPCSACGTATLCCAVLCCDVVPQVRGVLNDEEVQIAVADGRYLRGVHALVATPDMALALHSLPNSPLSFQVRWQAATCYYACSLTCV